MITDSDNDSQWMSKLLGQGLVSNKRVAQFSRYYPTGYSSFTKRESRNLSNGEI